MTEPTDLTPKETAERIVEAEVNRRVVAALAQQDIKREMKEIIKRLDHANNLKAEMVTKEQFAAFSARLDDRLGHFITKEDLGDGDFWIRHGVVQFDAAEQNLLKQRVELDGVAEYNRHLEHQEDERNTRHSDNRAYWIAAIFSAVMCLIAVLAWVHPHI